MPFVVQILSLLRRETHSPAHVRLFPNGSDLDAAPARRAGCGADGAGAGGIFQGDADRAGAAVSHARAGFGGAARNYAGVERGKLSPSDRGGHRCGDVGGVGARAQILRATSAGAGADVAVAVVAAAAVVVVIVEHISFDFEQNSHVQQHALLSVADFCCSMQYQRIGFVVAIVTAFAEVEQQQQQHQLQQQQQQHHQVPIIPVQQQQQQQQHPNKPLAPNNPIHDVISSGNFFFLQDSELDTPTEVQLPKQQGKIVSLPTTVVQSPQLPPTIQHQQQQPQSTI